MIDQTVAVPAATAALGALVAGVGTWLGKRAEKAPDIQASLSAAVAQVVEHYRVALDRSDEEAAEARREAEALRNEIAEMRRMLEDQTKKLDEQSIEIEQLSATAQREGLVKKICETVQVPRPKKRASS